jgi:hypothetical protein
MGVAQPLAEQGARLGADAAPYSFIAVDLHHLLLAGFTDAAPLPASGERVG